IAVDAALRPLGVGHAGLEPMWFIVILGARVLGPGFGFALGSLGLFVSALLTAGVGPWLPFQMLGAAWVGLGAGLLPRATGRSEITLMAAYGAIASFAYGLLLNLWFWPFTANLPAAVSYIPGASIPANLLAWITFTVVTSLGYDIPRAVLTVTLILIAGAPILQALRRVSRRAAFNPQLEFVRVP
ncbi:MAG: ECF transporter S component, partial [Actinobacteria bacterium]|nr:ECF transporter S component [Actinomycetota bacterium]